MGALTIKDTKDYLGIDFADESTDRVLEAILRASDQYLQGALGAGYPVHDERVKQVQRILISDLYDHRDLSDKAASASRRLVDSILMQVRLEMRGADA